MDYRHTTTIIGCHCNPTTERTSYELRDDEEIYPEDYDSYRVEVKKQLVTNEVYQPVEKVLKRLVSFLNAWEHIEE